MQTMLRNLRFPSDPLVSTQHAQAFQPFMSACGRSSSHLGGPFTYIASVLRWVIYMRRIPCREAHTARLPPKTVCSTQAVQLFMSACNRSSSHLGGPIRCLRPSGWAMYTFLASLHRRTYVNEAAAGRVLAAQAL